METLFNPYHTDKWSSRSEDPNRDKPFSFRWKSKYPEKYCHLKLPLVASEKAARAQELVLINAMLEANGTNKWISYSRRREWYAKQKMSFGYHVIVGAVDSLTAHGWLENEIAPSGSAVGRQSRFRAKPSLIEALTPPPPIIEIPGELIRLRDAYKLPIDYRRTAATEKMRRELQAINEGLRATGLSLNVPGVEAVGSMVSFDDYSVNLARRDLSRIFNLDFGRGGRHSGGWWQNCSKRLAHRSSIKMNGTTTVEEDYSQLHPLLLYKMCGKVLDTDAYTLDNYERDLCKRAFNILLCAKNENHAQSAIANAIGEAKGLGKEGIFDQKCHSEARTLINALNLKHKPVAECFYNGIGLKLQKTDSDIANHVLLKLQGKGIVALPIYDSFIVERQNQQVLKEVMAEAFCAIS
jgi:hypothetical protein